MHRKLLEKYSRQVTQKRKETFLLPVRVPLCVKTVDLQDIPFIPGPFRVTKWDLEHERKRIFHSVDSFSESFESHQRRITDRKLRGITVRRNVENDTVYFLTRRDTRAGMHAYSAKSETEASGNAGRERKYFCTRHFAYVTLVFAGHTISYCTYRNPIPRHTLY